MPPKSSRNAVINIKPEELVLQCEWRDCSQAFSSMQQFTQHVTDHLKQVFTEHQHQDDGFSCHWRECSADIEGETSAYLRHVYFHTFHVKIKCIGALLLQKTGHQPCTLDKQSRNLIPELPECLECGWEHCHHRYENAEMFYRHVENHADTYPDGNNVKNGCKCFWEGCDVKVKSRHKLKDHLRSHTQEKLVACPTCGALFSNRTKFFDHLDRQLTAVTGKLYQCSHCNRTFAAERLLRDHMRNHVNHYKCPYCDMTSPLPSNLRLHIKYRHTNEKPYKCESCEYSCKMVSDLRKHMEVHNSDQLYGCQVEGCKYTARAYLSLSNHYKRMHQPEGAAMYQCHLCDSKLSRGALLTNHLKKKHKFTWPSGHSRFRYKLHADGFWRLQTVRYESIELQGQKLSADSSATEDITNTQGLGGSSESDDMADLLTLDKDTSESPMNNTGFNMVETDVNSADSDRPSTSGKRKPSDGDLSSKRGKKNRKPPLVKTPDKEEKLVVSDNEIVSQLEEMSEEEQSDSDEEVVIQITTNEDGEYMIHRDNQRADEAVPLKLSGNSSLEENMYNLQMLGEVALQKR